MPRFKLLPSTMLMALVFIGIKTVDIIRGSEVLSNHLLVSNVLAETSGEAPKEIPKKEETAAAGEHAAEVDKKTEGHGDAAAGEHGGEHSEAAASEHSGGEHGAAASAGDEPSNVSDSPGITIDDHLSAVQVELLQKLADRHDELDRWEKDIQLKETVLDATEKRIDEKIGQIEALKSEVANMLAQYNEKEDAKIRSLVKIYENMKPKDAARIFDEVDMPVLLLVIDKMSEKKVAPILAGMDSKKAKSLTVQLAEQRKIDEEKMKNISSATQPAPAAPQINPSANTP